MFHRGYQIAEDGVYVYGLQHIQGRRFDRVGDAMSAIDQLIDTGVPYKYGFLKYTEHKHEVNFTQRWTYAGYTIEHGFFFRPSLQMGYRVIDSKGFVSPLEMTKEKGFYNLAKVAEYIDGIIETHDLPRCVTHA